MVFYESTALSKDQLLNTTDFVVMKLIISFILLNYLNLANIPIRSGLSFRKRHHCLGFHLYLLQNNEHLYGELIYQHILFDNPKSNLFSNFYSNDSLFLLIVLCRNLLLPCSRHRNYARSIDVCYASLGTLLLGLC